MGKIRDAVCKAAEEMMGVRTVRRREDWFNKECARATNEKNMARQRMLARNIRANRQNYENKRRIEKRTHRRWKREIKNERVKEMEKTD